MNKLVILSAAFPIAFTAVAKPPKPGLHTFTQPDGTEAKVYIRGDMHHHYFTDSLGWPLVKDNGFFYLADADKYGRLVSTGRAIGPGAGQGATRSSHVGLDKERILKALSQRGDSIRRAAMAPSGATTSGTTSYPGLQTYANFPTHGTQPVLIILAETPDVKFKLEDPKAHYTYMATEEGYSDYDATGSIRDWFLENSGGQFEPEFTIAGPVTVSKEMAYYGQNDAGGSERHVYEMIVEACRLLDNEVDFSKFDRDGDGYVDNVYMYYAGKAESSSGNKETIWPHAWNISSVTREKFKFDGVYIDRYACSNEIETDYYQTREYPDGIGTFVHEFSHVMGLPDLYYTGSSDSKPFTPGTWSVLDVGCYNNTSRTPPRYSAFERMALGWLDPTDITETMTVTLPPISENKAAVVMTSSPDEFFVFENRQQEGWDTYLPGHGMLVWHIDFNERAWWGNSVNNDPNHQRVDIIEADNLRTTSSYRNDPFPGTAKKTAFTPDTTPAFVTWAGEPAGCSITGITERFGKISFKATVSSAIDAAKEDKPEYNVNGRILSFKSLEPGAAVALYGTDGRKLCTATASPYGECTVESPCGGLVIAVCGNKGSVKLLLR